MSKFIKEIAEKTDSGGMNKTFHDTIRNRINKENANCQKLENKSLGT